MLISNNFGKLKQKLKKLQHEEIKSYDQFSIPTSTWLMIKLGVLSAMNISAINIQSREIFKQVTQVNKIECSGKSETLDIFKKDIPVNLKRVSYNQGVLLLIINGTKILTLTISTTKKVKIIQR